MALTGFVVVSCGIGNAQFDQEDEVTAGILGRRLREQEIEVEGRPRYFIALRPQSYTAGNPAVVLLHGGTQSMRKVLRRNTTTYRWVELATQEGFLLLVPNGVNFNRNDAYGDRQSWNDLRSGADRRRSRANDVGFVQALLNWASQKHGIDRSRIYVTGESNGGMMTLRLLVEQPQAFAAGAAFTASLPEEEIAQPSEGTPIMIMNGTDDPLVPWEGGAVSQGADPVRSVEETIDYWIQVNGADRTAATTQTIPTLDSTDECTITATSYPVKAGEPPVVLFYRVEGGGHRIPAINPPRYPAVVEKRLGNQCRGVNGIDLAWEFMKSFEKVNEENL